MFTNILYMIAFFVVTIIIQYSLRNKTTGFLSGLWVGTDTILGIAVVGIVMNDIKFFAAIIGFAVADKIGKILKWHN